LFCASIKKIKKKKKKKKKSEVYWAVALLIEFEVKRGVIALDTSSVLEG